MCGVVTAVTVKVNAWAGRDAMTTRSQPKNLPGQQGHREHGANQAEHESGDAHRGTLQGSIMSVKATAHRVFEVEGRRSPVRPHSDASQVVAGPSITVMRCGGGDPAAKSDEVPNFD